MGKKKNPKIRKTPEAEDMVNAMNATVADNGSLNQNHNVKKESLGPNTKR